ncbi:uncharacterized protein [Aegilops tauschii subsp. strangulata]|uniref:uncharacterized protein n=1 Tax=Aegilops tauschii subsp. strangulata TaxID=200361 RepID=UPI001ABD38C7|nr:atherin [Aegilops tauschii subsp. strangulata]
MEKLKESFKSERAGWDAEKTTLLKRADDAKVALNPVAEELSGLKQQINAMTAAIFGSRIAHLGSDMRKKLKAAHTLIEKLYTGAQRIICTASNNKPPPTLIKETLERLSMMPAQFEELKRSAARLAEAKAQIPLLTTPPALPLLFPKSPAPPPNVPTKHHPSATASLSLFHPRARRLPQRPVPLAVSSGRRGRPRGADAGRRVPGTAARGRGRGGPPHARAGGGRREAPPPQGEAEGPGQEDDPNTHTPAPILFSRDASSCKEGRGGGGGSVGVLPLHRRGALKIHEEEAHPTEDRAMRAVQAAVARKVFDKMTKYDSSSHSYSAFVSFGFLILKF